MQQKLISRNEDLKRLRDEGYEVEICGGYLLIHHIPYLNSEKNICFGTLVSTLTLRDSNTVAKPDNHVIHFIGDNPCEIDGNPISAIQHTNSNSQLGEIVVNRSFSNKPPDGYSNYYEKVKRYADIISSPPKSLDPTVTEKTFKPIIDKDYETVFNYIDTNSSRSAIDNINFKFQGLKIAIIGLGGTGSYILDLVAKTPVSEIHLFDGDDFDQHNAFRSPGAASIEDLEKHYKKADYLTSIYSNMHRKVIPHGYYIDDTNVDPLREMSFVFLSVDKNSVRKIIVDYLINIEIPFIDVGLGLTEVDGKLGGLVRTTTVTKERSSHVSSFIPVVDSEGDDAYSSNIQIADLNALNACFAVIRWKQFWRVGNAVIAITILAPMTFFTTMYTSIICRIVSPYIAFPKPSRWRRWSKHFKNIPTGLKPLSASPATP